MTVGEVRQPLEVEPEPVAYWTCPTQTTAVSRRRAPRPTPSRGIRDPRGRRSAAARGRFLREPPPHVGDAGEVDVDRDHVRPCAGAQPPGDLVQGLGRTRRHGHVGRRTPEELGSGLTGVLVRAGLGVVVEPDGSAPADRSLELLDGPPNRLGNQRDRRRVQVREFVGGREIRWGPAIRPSASGYSSAATPAFAEAGEPSTGRGTFGAAHAFPIRERCLLGSSTRQKVVPSNSGDPSCGCPVRVGGRSRGLAPPRSPASPEALLASRSLRPLGTGANSSDEHSTCQRGDAGWAQAVPSDVAGSGARTRNEERVTNDLRSVAGLGRR